MELHTLLHCLICYFIILENTKTVIRSIFSPINFVQSLLVCVNFQQIRIFHSIFRYLFSNIQIENIILCFFLMYSNNFLTIFSSMGSAISVCAKISLLANNFFSLLLLLIIDILKLCIHVVSVRVTIPLLQLHTIDPVLPSKQTLQWHQIETL